ncbi:unnamed protein product [Clavelina lepadiformis]|uniref:Uncharacterized protein n=1 Tax=Clavelina lepadiformis TaxID=159417 RepID=A0ABP0G7J4_CLALP
MALKSIDKDFFITKFITPVVVITTLRSTGRMSQSSKSVTTCNIWSVVFLAFGLLLATSSHSKFLQLATTNPLTGWR